MLRIRCASVWNAVLIINFVTLVCGDLPAEVQKCLPGEGTCIAKTINDIFRRFPKGNSEFGLQPVDSVHIDHLSVPNRPGNSPIQLNIEFDNLTAYGIEGATIERVVGFEKDPSKSKFEVYGTIPDFKMEGNYELNGKMLLLPINGKGKSKIYLKNLKIGVKVQVSESRRDGKLYLNADKILSTVQTDLLQVDFENLLGENKEVGASINKVINENWREVFVELEDSIAKAVAAVANQLVSAVLAKLPYEDFFREE